MQGWVILHRLSDLDLIVSCWPFATLDSTLRAHYPDCTTHAEALRLANAQFGSVPGHLVLSYGEAMERVRALVQQRRAKASRQVRQRRVGR